MIKKHNMKLTAMSLVVGLALMTGCGKQAEIAVDGGVSNSTTTITATATNTNIVDGTGVQVNYDTEDYYTDWTNSQVTQITLGDTVEVSGIGVQVADSVVTITNGGTYVLSGELTEGQIVIDLLEKDTVRLVLNGVNITCSNGPAIYVKNADKLVVSLEEGTENTLTDGTNYVLEEGSDEPNAALFSKDDLIINGTGTLNVNANYQDAIASKDSLKIMEGTINVNAAEDGIRGKDKVVIKDGNITITSVGEGIKSTNTNDASLGFVYIENGTFNLTTESDAIQAETDLEILDGTFNITTGGGSVNGVSHRGNMMGAGGMGGKRPQKGQMSVPPDEGMTRSADTGIVAPPDAGMTRLANEGTTAPSDATTSVSTSQSETTVSKKALKATDVIVINDGTFNIDASDDALHSNNIVTINGGNLSIATGDDGLHADVALTINGGIIDITKSYEGLEGETITIEDGEISVVASDDGINAAEASGTEDAVSGDLMNPNGNAALIVNGGLLYVNASGDGLDANGAITINNGTVIVDGPTNGGNGSLDYDKTCDVNGGTLIAAGSSQMAQSISTTSAQKAVDITFTTVQVAGQTVAVLDETGKAVVSFTGTKEFQTVTITSDLFESDKTYTFSYGGTVSGETTNGLGTNVEYTGGTTVCEFTMSDVVTYLNESGVTTAPVGGMMGGHGNFGGRGMRGKGSNAAQTNTSVNTGTNIEATAR